MDADLLLCDYAQVNSGKLYVVGAGISLLVTSPTPPHPVNVWLGALLTIPWEAHNRAHRLKIGVVSEDGDPVAIAQAPPGTSVPPEDEGRFVAEFNVGRSAILQPGESSYLPLAVPLNAPHPTLGAYKATLEVDGSEISVVRYRVMANNPFNQGVG